jgi:hypothetical protein
MIRSLNSILKTDTALVALFLTVCVGGSTSLCDAVQASAVEALSSPFVARNPATEISEDVGAPAGAQSPEASEAAKEPGPAAGCNPDGTIVYGADEAEPSCPANANDSIAADRTYLVETATPGYTMVRQGPELAIARLHPEFAQRLAAAIREARQAGLSSAGIFSAYRPPAFGIGGFSDKFNSLHTYGLAVDMAGIGGPGSAEAKTWHEIAARNGVVCPYGFENRLEWNHCQPTRIKIILPQNPLRETVTADGPIDLGSMFEAGSVLINNPQREGDSIESGSDHGLAERHDRDLARRLGELAEIDRSDPHGGRFARSGIHIGPLSEAPSWCRHLHHPDKAACGPAHQIETAARKPAVHSRQAALKIAKESRRL